MKVKALVIAEEVHSFKTRKGEEIKQILLTALDKTDQPEYRFRNTFDIALDGKIEDYKQGVNIDKVVEFALTDLSQIFSGRARYRGVLIEKSIKV